MNRLLQTLCLAGLLSFCSCSQRAFVRFTQKPPELNSSDALTQLMLVNKSPKIVLRVPHIRTGVTNTQTTSAAVRTGQPMLIKRRRGVAAEKDAPIQSQYDESALYNAIEKQLFKEGFSVRDRALFDQVLPNESYAHINALTDTDLILELINIERPVGYNTNVCYLADDVDNSADRSIVMRQDHRTLGGASVEFKLINIRTNEVIGNYKIHYTPCTDDSCRGYYNKNTGFRRAMNWYRSDEISWEKRRRGRNKAFEAIDQNVLELFMADATHQLVESMR